MGDDENYIIITQTQLINIKSTCAWCYPVEGYSMQARNTAYEWMFLLIMRFSHDCKYIYLFTYLFIKVSTKHNIYSFL